MGLDFFTVKFANKRGKADVSKVLTSKSKASNSDFAHEILSKISSGFEASLGSAKKDLNLSMLSIPCQNRSHELDISYLIPAVNRISAL